MREIKKGIIDSEVGVVIGYCMQIMERPHSGCRGAEVVLNLHPSLSISIAYDTNFGPHDDLILLEVDEKLLPDFFHQRVSLRGEQSEDAVLCTQSKTYSIKFVGTSNSVFLIPPVDNLTLYENSEDCNMKDNHKSIVAVIKVAPGNMELVEVAPRLDKLKLLLLESPYSSREELEFEGLEEMDRSITKRMYRWDDLVDKVQASENELRSGLQAFSAVEIDGYWRLVDEKYMGTILIMLLHNSVLNDWSLDALNEDEVVSTLVSDGFPLKLSQHCLHVFGSKVEEGSVRKSLWRLDERRVCVHFAREILVEGKRKMDNFMEEWKLKVPKGMHADFEMLEGEVLTEKLGVESWVHAFSVSSLPSTPAERFSILFKERPKWEQRDLLPYIRDLNVPGISLEGMLLKYTRRTQPVLDAEPVFSAR